MSSGVPPALPWSDLEAFRAQQRAANPVPAIDAVPAELADRPQWLVWRYEAGESPEKKPRKMPYYVSGHVRSGDQGGDRDRERLVVFAVAAAAATRGGSGGFDGVGFAFLPGDGLIGIDLDAMIDPETGAISPRCAAIVAGCASYTEFSPSGKGVHIICRGTGKTFKSNRIGVEVFCGRQFFTFTGRPWPGAPAVVGELDAAVLRRLEATVRAARGPAGGVDPDGSAVPLEVVQPAPEVFGGRTRSLAETVVLVEEALTLLTADEYEQWIAVGMACKAGLGSAGYYVWDAWSARSEKYAGGEDTRKRFHGFQPAKISLGTVFGLARDAGWVAPWDKARARRPRRAARSGADGDDAGTGEPPAREKAAAASGNGHAGGAGDAGEVGDRADEAPASAAAVAGAPGWRKALLCTTKGDLVCCLANVYDILLHSEVWAGVLGFDEFAQRTVKLKAPPYFGGERGEWTGADDSRTAIWLSRVWRFSPATALVAEAIETLALANSFHPVRDWLRALPPWDGISRADMWLCDFLDVDDSPYVRLVARFYLIGMVARVMRPGVKFDYCLVAEGPQGEGKSSVAAVLGGEWFGDTDLDLHNKDAMSALRGKWVYEFAEMGSVTRSEASRQKSFLSRQFDEFRPVYGRREIRLSRQVVFFGTTNEWEWNKDPTGGRRFWPVAVRSINLEGLRAVRDQLFAEALALFDAGERFWPTKEEQRRLFDPEQLAREQSEGLIDALHDWVYGQVSEFSLATAVMEGLKLDASKLTRDLQTRVGQSLIRLGCRKVERRNGLTRFWYTPPPVAGRVTAVNGSQPAQLRSGSWVSGDDDAPF